MAERALYLRVAIDDVIKHVKFDCDRQRKPLLAALRDKLSADDWYIIKQYHEILQPTKEATKILQGHAGGRFGCI